MSPKDKLNFELTLLIIYKTVPNAWFFKKLKYGVS